VVAASSSVPHSKKHSTTHARTLRITAHIAVHIAAPIIAAAHIATRPQLWLPCVTATPVTACPPWSPVTVHSSRENIPVAVVVVVVAAGSAVVAGVAEMV
jgi:hypothetical protein